MPAMIRLLPAAILGLAACAQLGAVPPIASPVALARDGRVAIALSEQPCTLDAVANLRFHATWEEDGARHAGCWDVQHGRIVVTYWADRTVVVLPLEIFLGGRTS